MNSSTGQRVRRLLVATIVTTSLFWLCGTRHLLGTRKTEIDINSGRVRTQLSIFGIHVSTSVAETPFSEAVARYGLNTEPADYRFGGEGPFGVQTIFGHWCGFTMYGSAAADLRSLETVYELDPSLRLHEREHTAKLLSMLKNGDAMELSLYMNSLWEEPEQPLTP